ncbi:phosphatidylethanolamine/phosphatidyl-N-methylethanolamine N-methyltransferase [Aminobacter lissarensis]|uniref:Phosphatidylethanolamine/phosphatidyl-N-methylethanolamine N-methyltransferase n=1 Tax=Aminobacter carboxidus TaxID=376165 RepID=A0A8E1W984_9HYPH|nr:methyltransferase domain-containing protein [Aminobacter lissarensis]MBB6464370.1 phosphatidylethanolamine/phosphatidyl-N-methylethanolamine N-methyltransferase [Aminobacter lissarensis]
MTELNAFAAQLLRRPRQVSALAPSSPTLCQLMAGQLPRWARRVAEFGPGTGNITREILKLGIDPGELFLYEVNPVFCRMLRDRHPDVTVFYEPAEALAYHGPQQVDAVVSGLPLLSMSAAQQQAILTAAFSRLGPDGVYIQFTYGLFSPLRRSVADSLGLEFTRSPRVWRNLPPAVVYVYRRKRN